ncbi:aromatic ring-hydroxylating dioxygenase subunit alpha [Roseovarius faecimaris]|uniref:Aromatic ring-hydroxylating dioxygenase subunit alpha n=1 Tax=Roseovarius faecimaris TaxID=2494550 RepID=A0A6I6ITD4_9RHOB|nr:aromatic ring-hydroxylating dioxygenase subunit alpha [Roseovarius faecimaris]QGY00006.1 aromatic ring-hydroxylating dioxygenase subunit alpha [Roseovarius faecimaris]
MTDLAQMRQTLQELAALPPDAPFGLPGIFYTSPEFFEWECQTLLRRGWYCLGRADEVPQAGDYFTVQLLNEPLIVVRGGDGEIRVLSNVCRHRGMPLAEGSGNANRFVCSYHAWAYGHDGALLRAARMKNEGFDQKNCKLPSFPVQLWRGFIYTSLDPAAAPFGPDTKALDDMVSPYEPDNFRHVYTGTETWKCNWKCLVENFMEGYHLSVVHPQTLHGYTPTGLARKSVSGPGFTSYCANYPQDIPSRGAGAPGLSAEQRQRSSLFARFPNQVASQAATLLVSLSIFPRKVDEIEVRWTMSVYGDELDGDTIDQRIALWNEVNREDREKLEWMQVGLASSHAGSGPLAGEDYEGTVRDFLLWLAHMDQDAGVQLSIA